jgi:predicted GNAT family N-acyltransferase
MDRGVHFSLARRLLKTEVFRLQELPADLRKKRAKLLLEEFGLSGQNDAAGSTWKTPEWVLGASTDGDLVGHVSICHADMRVGSQVIGVGGIGHVVTARPWRGTGIGTLCIERAMEFIRDRVKVKFALLGCNKQLVPLYERFGWRLVNARRIFEQPTGTKVWPMETMICEFSKDSWPAGEIDMNGLPW